MTTNGKYRELQQERQRTLKEGNLGKYNFVFVLGYLLYFGMESVHQRFEWIEMRAELCLSGGHILLKYCQISLSKSFSGTRRAKKCTKIQNARAGRVMQLFFHFVVAGVRVAGNDVFALSCLFIDAVVRTRTAKNCTKRKIHGCSMKNRCFCKKKKVWGVLVDATIVFAHSPS